MFLFVAPLARGQGLADGFVEYGGVLGGPCCVFSARPDLPLPPAPFDIPSVYECFRDCDRDGTHVGVTTFDIRRATDFTPLLAGPGFTCAAPTIPPSDSDEVIITLSNAMINDALLPPTPFPTALPFPNLFTISLRGKYAETWLVDDADFGTIRQTWRYLVHGNADFAEGLQSPCPVPEGVNYTGPGTMSGVLLPFDAPPFVGYVDISRTSNGPPEHPRNPVWSASLVIGHMTGCISHNATVVTNGLALSANPVTDPSGAAVRAIADRRHYVLVAPRSDSRPYFNFAPVIPQAAIAMTLPNGVFGTYRSSDDVIAPNCFRENDAIFDSNPFGAPACFCGQGATQGLYYDETISSGSRNGVYCDPGPPANGNVLFRWNAFPTGMGASDLVTGFKQLKIGSWLSQTNNYHAGGGSGTSLADHIIRDTVFLNFGILEFVDPCFGGGMAPATFHLIHGVSTLHPEEHRHFFVDVPTPFHLPSTTLNLQFVNTVNSNVFVHPASMAMVAPNSPYFAASGLRRSFTGPMGTVNLPSTQSMLVWSFGR